MAASQLGYPLPAKSPVPAAVETPVSSLIFEKKRNHIHPEVEMFDGDDVTKSIYAAGR